MKYVCPVCGNDLSPHGTAGVVCTLGHHFLAADIRREEAPRMGKRGVPVPLWLPGAVLGGLALAVEVVEAVI